MKLNWKLLFSFVLLVPTHVGAENLSLDAFLKELENNHPFIVAQKRNPEISQQEQQAELGTKDWQLSASTKYNYNEPPELGVAVADSTQSSSIEGTISKNIWETGGTFSANLIDSYLNQKQRQSIETQEGLNFFTEDFYNKGVFLSYEQPLLKNRGGLLDSLSYDLRGFDNVISEARSEESVEQFLLSSGLLYIQWAEQVEKVAILNERVALAKKQLEQTKRRRSAGVTDDADLFRAEESYWAATQALNLNASSRDGLKAQIINLLKRDSKANLSPSINLQSEKRLPSSSELDSKLEQNTRLLRILQLQKDQEEKNLQGLEEEKEHDLSLNLSAGLQSGAEEYSDSFDLDKPQAGIALNYTRPIGTTRENAQITRSRIRLGQIESEYRDQLITLSSTGSSLLSQLKRLRSVLEANREQIKSAARRTKGEQELYTQGRGDLNFVIQSQDSEQAAKFSYAEVGSLYQSLHLQLRELTDSIIPPKASDS